MKMKKDKNRFIVQKAMFLIFLVLTMPLYSSFVYATITKSYIGGEAGYDGYAAEDDTLTLEFFTDKDMIVPYEDTNNRRAFECDLDNETSKTRCVKSLSNPLPAGEHTISLTEIADENVVPGKTDFSFNIDGVLPEVMNLGLEQDLVGLKFNYSVKDSLEPNVSDTCSGILYIEIHVNGEIYKRINLSQTGCTYPSVGHESMYLNATKDGLYSVFIKTVDMAGNIFFSEPITAYYDAVGPIVSNLRFLHAETNQDIKKVSGGKTTAEYVYTRVVFDIEDRNLDKDSVYIDATGMFSNPIYNVGYDSVKIQCTETGIDKYRCYSNTTVNSFGGTLILQPNNQSVPVTVFAKDIYNNEIERVVVKNIEFDRTIAKGNDLVIEDKCNKDDMCFVNDDPVHRVEVTFGKGTNTFEKQRVYFDLQAIGGNPAAAAFECNLIGSKWKCYTLLGPGDGMNTGQIRKISMNENTVDDLGKRIEETKTEVMYDNINPIVYDIDGVDEYKTPEGVDECVGSEDNVSEWLVVDHATNSGRHWFETNDHIEFKLFVNDSHSGIKEVLGNFSQFSDGVIKTGDCSRVSNSSTGYICKFEGDNDVQAKKSGRGLNPIFTVTDWAGNSINLMPCKGVDVLYKAGSQGNFFDFQMRDAAQDSAGSQTDPIQNITVVPEALDLISFANFPNDSSSMWLTAVLDESSTGGCDATIDGVVDMNTLSIGFNTKYNTECYLTYNETESGFENTTYEEIEAVFEKLKIFRTAKPYKKDDKLLFELELNGAELEPEMNLSYTCPLSIISRCGAGVYPPQAINLTFMVPTTLSDYDAGDEIEDEIEKEKDDLKDQRWVDDMYKLFEDIRKACAVWGTLNGLMTALATVFGAVACALNKGVYEWVGHLLNEANFLGGVVFEVIGEIINYTCEFVSCTLPLRLLSPDEPGKKEFNNKEANNIIGALKEVAKTGSAGQGFAKSLIGLQSTLIGSPYEISKKSIIFSLIFACIPGVVYNLKQARNIDCQYVYCLENTVVEDGISPYVCGATKAYNYCLFIYGQYFYSLPFALIFKAISNIIKLFGNNPYTAATIGVSLYCGKLNIDKSGSCKEERTLCIAWHFFNGVVSLLNSANAIATMNEPDYEPPIDYCEELDL